MLETLFFAIHHPSFLASIHKNIWDYMPLSCISHLTAYRVLSLLPQSQADPKADFDPGPKPDPNHDPGPMLSSGLALPFLTLILALTLTPTPTLALTSILTPILSFGPQP